MNIKPKTNNTDYIFIWSAALIKTLKTMKKSNIKIQRVKKIRIITKLYEEGLLLLAEQKYEIQIIENELYNFLNSYIDK